MSTNTRDASTLTPQTKEQMTESREPEVREQRTKTSKKRYPHLETGNLVRCETDVLFKVGEESYYILYVILVYHAPELESNVGLGMVPDFEALPKDEVWIGFVANDSIAPVLEGVKSTHLAKMFHRGKL